MDSMPQRFQTAVFCNKLFLYFVFFYKVKEPLK